MKKTFFCAAFVGNAFFPTFEAIQAAEQTIATDGTLQEDKGPIMCDAIEPQESEESDDTIEQLFKEVNDLLKPGAAKIQATNQDLQNVTDNAILVYSAMVGPSLGSIAEQWLNRVASPLMNFKTIKNANASNIICIQSAAYDIMWDFSFPKDSENDKLLMNCLSGLSRIYRSCL
jgi:hypothetical protein